MAGWAASDIPDQSGRTALVTGANSGLGLRAAQALAAHGARVLLGCRNPERAEAARAEVAAVATGPEPQVVPLDLADLAAVRVAAERVAAGVDRLDLLLNNAGLMGPPLGRTADGFEMQFGVNHLGHFALTGLLLPTLLAAPAPRVVTTSSNLHHRGKLRWDDPNYEAGRYSRWAAYAQSKLANLLFVSELGRRAAGAGTDLVSAAGHPGYAATHLGQNSAAQLGNPVLTRIAGLALAIGDHTLAQSDAAGALPLLYAATAPGVASGDYYGPGGLFEMRGAPVKVRVAPAAADAGSGHLLWELSERLTSVSYPWP
ncbi:MAG TPA: oxidoreductase [Acidimicrobiales bacterium]|nr:oxidoreductase [Acidimicrobiales bacterium]